MCPLGCPAVALGENAGRQGLFWDDRCDLRLPIQPSFEYPICESIMETAVRNGDAKKVAELIREDPGFNVTMAVDGNEWTLLHVACF